MSGSSDAGKNSGVAAPSQNMALSRRSVDLEKALALELEQVRREGSEMVPVVLRPGVAADAGVGRVPDVAALASQDRGNEVENGRLGDRLVDLAGPRAIGRPGGNSARRYGTRLWEIPARLALAGARIRSGAEPTCKEVTGELEAAQKLIEETGGQAFRGWCDSLAEEIGHAAVEA